MNTGGGISDHTRTRTHSRPSPVIVSSLVSFEPAGPSPTCPRPSLSSWLRSFSCFSPWCSPTPVSINPSYLRLSTSVWNTVVKKFSNIDLFPDCLEPTGILLVNGTVFLHFETSDFELCNYFNLLYSECLRKFD